MTNEDIKKQVLELLRQDNRYQAVRLLQSHYGVSEADAKKLLESIQRERPLTSASALAPRPLSEPPPLPRPAPQGLPSPVPTDVSQTSAQLGGCIGILVKVVAIMLFFFGLLMFLLAGAVYYFADYVQEKTVPVTGYIAETSPAPRNLLTDSSEVYLFIRYSYNDSLYYQLTPEAYDSARYQPGDSIRILIHPEDPSKISMNTDWLVQNLLWFFIPSGLVSWLIAFIVWRIGRGIRRAAHAARYTTLTPNA